MNKVDLSKFDKSLHDRGASLLKYVLWNLTSIVFFKTSINPFSGLKIFLLRCFGARIGKGVVMSKPDIRIKYPWRLSVGDHVWIGEKVWIYNLDHVYIGSHSVLAQEAMLLTGNHNLKSPRFETFTKPIKIEDGVFIGARSIVCPGVTCKSHAVLTVGSIATKDLEPYSVYQGNPAVKIRQRVITNL